MFQLCFWSCALGQAKADVRDFRANNGSYSGLTDFRIYTPPAIETPRIRGVILIMPGSSGDFRFFAQETVFQEAARALGFAIIANDQAGGYFSITESHARAGLNNILSAAAEVTGRRELVNAPIILSGFSLGGIMSTALSGRVPERTISIIAHKGANDYASNSPEVYRYVQQLWIPGSADKNPQVGPAMLRNKFPAYRGPSNPSGEAAFAVDWRSDHGVVEVPNNPIWSMTWTWIAETIAQRYPEDAVPSTLPDSPLVLRNQPLDAGWLGERSYVTSSVGADHSAFLNIAPYDAYPGDKANASWLPTETAARAYRALSSFDDNMTRVGTPLQSPLLIGGDAAPTSWSVAIGEAGSTLQVKIDPRDFDDGKTISQMEVFSGGELAGVLTETNADGAWEFPVTLGAKGIYTLTAVATDSLGAKTSSLRTVVAAARRETGVRLWRMENTYGVLTDHYDNNNLVFRQDLSRRPTAIPIPESGPGSAFCDWKGEFSKNETAMRFMGTGVASQYLTTPDSAEYTSGNNRQFTFEALFSLSSSAAPGKVRGIAGHGGYATSQMGWALAVTADHRLVLEFTESGAMSQREQIDSGFQIQTGVDYYVAIAFDPSDTTDSGAIFYLMDLTNQGSLLTSRRPHTLNSMWDSELGMIIGDVNNPWDGLIDEVRFTNRVLSAPELMIYDADPPSASPPPTPDDLTAKAGNGKVSLSWTATGSNSVYNIKRGTASRGPFSIIAHGIASTTFLDSGLANGTSYYYVVTALVDGIEGAHSSQAWATPALSPTGLVATAGDGSVALTWQPVIGATGYNVHVGLISGQHPQILAADLQETKFFDTNLTNGTTYFYVVTAKTDGGLPGPESNEASATPMTAPKLIRAVSRKSHGSSGDFELSLPVNGTSGVEPRGGAPQMLVLTFDKPLVEAGTVSVVSGSAQLGAPNASGSTLSIPLGDVADRQKLTFEITGAKTADGSAYNGMFSVRVLAGDANRDGAVNVADTAAVKSASGSPVTAATASRDVNADGVINVADTARVKAASGSSVND